MTVLSASYAFKTSNITAVQFTGDAEALEEIRDWVISILPEGTPVNFYGSMKSMNWEVENQIPLYVSYGKYICVDGNGKIFITTADILNAVYDLVP